MIDVLNKPLFECLCLPESIKQLNIYSFILSYFLGPPNTIKSHLQFLLFILNALLPSLRLQGLLSEAEIIQRDNLKVQIPFRQISLSLKRKGLSFMVQVLLPRPSPHGHYMVDRLLAVADDLCPSHMRGEMALLAQSDDPHEPLGLSRLIVVPTFMGFQLQVGLAALTLIESSSISEGSETVPVGLYDRRSNACEPAITWDQVDEEVIAAEMSNLTQDLCDCFILHLLICQQSYRGMQIIHGGS